MQKISPIFGLILMELAIFSLAGALVAANYLDQRPPTPAIHIVQQNPACGAGR